MLEDDYCVYVKQWRRDFLILFLYVDDILIVGNDMDMIVTALELSSTFDMKITGKWIVCLELRS